MARPIHYIGSRLPRGWWDLLLQFGLFYVAYQGYSIVRGVVDSKADVAFSNAERLVDWERSLGLYFEQGFQQATLPHDWIIDICNWLYINSHFTITITFLAWLYLFHNDNFYFVRNMFMVAMGFALVGYMLYPTAPPRLLPDGGYVDTVTAFTGGHGNKASFLINDFAAVPSMHIGFSTMIAGTAFKIVRNPVGKWLWLLYPVLVFFVIVLTANHFWLDAAAGAVVACASALIAWRVLAPVRPQQWAFRPEPPGEAPAEATA